MEIKKINQEEIWEDFLLNCREKTFLQSWNWGEFQKLQGHKIWRFGIFNERVLVSVALVLKIQAKRGTFLFLPHSPSVTPADEDGTNEKYEILKTILEKLKKIAKEEKASFIRISPIWERNEENMKIFKDLGFKEAPIHMHPELTWELDITPSEEQLLMEMRKTTRYLVKQAQKNPDVSILKSQQTEDVEKFNELYQKTTERHSFIPFSFDYLKNEVSVFLKDNQVMIFLGKYKEELLASAIIIFWQGVAFYHQGASSSEYPKIPVSYLLQWEAIREAKKRGCSIYNFWGIAPSGEKKHPWVGLTLFKTGFGGYKKEYVKTQDFVLSSRYWLNYWIEKIRKSKRSL